MVKKKIHPGGEGTFMFIGGCLLVLLLGVMTSVGALTSSGLKFGSDFWNILRCLTENFF